MGETEDVESGLELSWGRLHYTISGDGPWIVLIHGWSYTTHTWDTVVPPLVGAGFRVLAYDVRGHGDSLFTGTQLTMDELVDDLGALLGTLGVDRAVLCGHSMGGMIALAFTLRRPAAVTGLALVDTGAAARPADIELDKMLADYLTTSTDIGYWWDILQPTLYSPGFVARSPEAVRAAKDRFLRSDLTALHVAFRTLATREDLTPRLREVAVPAVVVVGEADPVFSVEDHAAMAAAIPDARLVVLPGAGHLTTEEAGPVLADWIVRFATSRTP